MMKSICWRASTAEYDRPHRSSLLSVCQMYHFPFIAFHIAFFFFIIMNFIDFSTECNLVKRQHISLYIEEHDDCWCWLGGLCHKESRPDCCFFGLLIFFLYTKWLILKRHRVTRSLSIAPKPNPLSDGVGWASHCDWVTHTCVYGLMSILPVDLGDRRHYEASWSRGTLWCDTKFTPENASSPKGRLWNSTRMTSDPKASEQHYAKCEVNTVSVDGIWWGLAYCTVDRKTISLSISLWSRRVIEWRRPDTLRRHDVHAVWRGQAFSEWFSVS